MERTRIPAVGAIVAALVLGTGVVAGTGGLSDPVPVPVVSAAVSWPTSTLLLSEVQTGGASASDEFVEVANQGADPVDLAGLEVAYVTSTGGTITRKAAWVSPTILDPGRRVLLANALGIHAAGADATYSGGFAATGGALVLRPVGGAPIDAVGWGDASNAFVEGTPAAAPAVGSSIERRPGGIAGNGHDTNDNALDFLETTPSPQGSAAPPVPAPGATPEPTATPTSTPLPTADPTPDPTGPDPTPTPDPTATATVPPSATPLPSPTPLPTRTPEPSPTPDATPQPTSPAPTASPTAPPTPTPTPTPMSIADARLLADGSSATVLGTLTTSLGALESGRSAFIEDASGGISIYLDAATTEAWPAGSIVLATGTLDDRYAQRTLRAPASGLVLVGAGPLPDAIPATATALGEVLEGRRVTIEGTAVGDPTPFADGTGLLVDDGTGQARLIVLPDVLADQVIPSGTAIEATGPLGQRDSSGTGTAGYRVFVARPGDLVARAPEPPPTASPSPMPSQSPGHVPPPTPAPTTAPTPGPTPTPSPVPTPTIVSIVTARSVAVGTTLTTTGIVTAEAGRLGSPALIAIGDESGAGMVVRVPDGETAPSRGLRVVVRGKLADPYGQLEIRPPAGALVVVGTDTVPNPAPIGAADLGERTEARLVVIDGTVTAPAVRSTSGDLSIVLGDPGLTSFRVLVDASAGMDRAAFHVGTRYRVTGIVGQRASRKGVLDGYRVWARDAADVIGLGAGSGSSGSDPAGGSSATSSRPSITIAAAIRQGEGAARIEGIVTIAPTLLDSTGRRIVVQDASASIEVLLPGSASAPSIGSRVVVDGELGRAYGAPRLRAATVTRLGSAAVPRPWPLSGAPGPAHEWRLVVVSGTVADVTRLGDRWRAELLVGKARLAIVGQAGAGIPSTALVEGRRATIVGIVRRPYPTATDRRFAVLPRASSDVRLAPAEPGTGEGSVTISDNALDPRGMAGSRGGVAGSNGAALPAPPDVDLGDLAGYEGTVVRVGGLVVRAVGSVIALDDGSAVASIHLLGEAASLATLLERGDPINAIGRVVRLTDGSLGVAVEDPGGVLRIGALGQALSIGLDPGSSDAGNGFGGGSDDRDGPGGHRDAVLGLVPDPATGVLGLVFVAVLSVVATVIRRVVARRRLTARVAARVAMFAGVGAPQDGASGGDPSIIRS